MGQGTELNWNSNSAIHYPCALQQVTSLLSLGGPLMYKFSYHYSPCLGLLSHRSPPPWLWRSVAFPARGCPGEQSPWTLWQPGLQGELREEERKAGRVQLDGQVGQENVK